MPAWRRGGGTRRRDVAIAVGVIGVEAPGPRIVGRKAIESSPRSPPAPTRPPDVEKEWPSLWPPRSTATRPGCSTTNSSFGNPGAAVTKSVRRSCRSARGRLRPQGELGTIAALLRRAAGRQRDQGQHGEEGAHGDSMSHAGESTRRNAPTFAA
jgi:hypothetical protein